jgi:gas vesicle protein
MATATQLSQMELAVQELNTQLGRVVVAAINGTVADWLLADGSGNAARQTFVDLMRKGIDALDAARDKVSRGEWTFEKWAALANDYRRTIASELRESADWSLSAYVSDVAKATASDTVDAAEKVADKAEFALPLVAAIVVGLVLLKVL